MFVLLHRHGFAKISGYLVEAASTVIGYRVPYLLLEGEVDGGQFCSINSVRASSAGWVQAYANGIDRECASWYVYAGSGSILSPCRGMFKMLCACVRILQGGGFLLSSAKAAICVDYVIPFNSTFLGWECVAQGCHGVQCPCDWGMLCWWGKCRETFEFTGCRGPVRWFLFPVRRRASSPACVKVLIGAQGMDVGDGLVVDG